MMLWLTETIDSSLSLFKALGFNELLFQILCKELQFCSTEV